MIYIGVDPGTTGAIAIINEDMCIVYDFQDPKSLDVLLKMASGDGNPSDGSFQSRSVRAVVEKVHAMPRQGVSTTFKFGLAYGKVMGWLDACLIPYELVTPQKWWKGVADSAPKGTDKKAAALELARRLFPELAPTYLRRKKDHNRAEALLIAEYCRRTRQ